MSGSAQQEIQREHGLKSLTRRLWKHRRHKTALATAHIVSVPALKEGKFRYLPCSLANEFVSNITIYRYD
jgi:hypothetical protein